jgi:ubiquinone/menaquinone biosynthesis C-methylase UbiE
MTATQMEVGVAHQRRIDAHFDADSHFWKSLYSQASLYGTIHQERHALALAWISELGLPHDSPVLEIGCGAGLLATELAGRGHHVTAIDSSQAMVDLAQAHASEAGVQDTVSVSVGDAHTLPFATASYDLVIALGVIPFLHTPATALAEMVRVVKPNGFVLLNSDNRYRLNHVLDPWFTPLFAPVKHLARGIARRLGFADRKALGQYYSYAALKRLLANAGLTITRSRVLGFGPFSFVGRHLLPESVAIRVHRRLQSLADRGTPLLRSTGAQHIVLASRVDRPAAPTHEDGDSGHAGSERSHEIGPA